MKNIYATRTFAARVEQHTGTGLLTTLKESIEARGILNPLIVDATKQGRQYRLVDGAFRFFALKQLVNEGKIKRDTYMVPCLVKPYEAPVTMTSDYHAPFAQEIFDETAVMAPALFDFQIKMIEELKAKGRIKWAVGDEVDSKIHSGNLFSAYQAEKRAHRVGQPHKAVNFMIQADFSGMEVALAHYAQKDAEYTRLLLDVWNRPKERYFDLGDTW